MNYSPSTIFNACYGFAQRTIQLNFYTAIFPMYRGGYLGVTWGFPGGFLGVRRGGPLGTPNKVPIKSHCSLIVHNMSVY